MNITGGDFNLTVLDITGKALLSAKGNKVDLSGLASGVYILKGENDNSSFAKQIIKK